MTEPDDTAIDEFLRASNEAALDALNDVLDLDADLAVILRLGTEGR